MDLSSLRTDIRFITNTTSDDFSDTDIDRSINRYYDQFVTFIWKNQAYWRFSDSNYDKFDVSITSLVPGQPDYKLPTDARQIFRVEVKNSGGDLQLLRRLHEPDVGISLDEYGGEDGTPHSFALRGRSIILYPAPASDSVTTTEGLNVYVSRSVTELSATDDEPGFDREFHRVLSYGASIDWCISSENFKKKRELEKELQKIMESAREYYANRDQTIPPRFRVKKESYES